MIWNDEDHSLLKYGKRRPKTKDSVLPLRWLFTPRVLQHGDLNILWNCLYRSTFFYIIIAQWSRALVMWTAGPEFKSPETFVKSYWNKFLKVIFLPKNDFSFDFCHTLLYFSSSNYFVLILSISRIHVTAKEITPIIIMNITNLWNKIRLRIKVVFFLWKIFFKKKEILGCTKTGTKQRSARLMEGMNVVFPSPPSPS